MCQARAVECNELKEPSTMEITIIGLDIAKGSGRVARPFGSALTDPGRRLSRTRLFPEVTRVMPHVVSKDG
jgi:hypothetical protein